MTESIQIYMHSFCSVSGATATDGIGSSSSNSSRHDNALHTACRYGHREIAAVLMHHGYGPHARGSSSSTPLLLAAAGGAAVHSRLGATKSKDQQQQQQSCAMAAAALAAATGAPLSPAVALAAATGSSSSSGSHRAALCGDLIARNADLSSVDQSGFTVVMAAAAGGMQQLLHQAMLAAAAAGSSSSRDVVRQSDAAGWTALHWASANGHEGG